MIRRTTLLLVASCALPALAEDSNWPLPAMPPGANAVTFAVPRNDWMVKHEANVARARAGGVDLLFLGDSISENWKNVPTVWNKHFGTIKAATFGISADRIENILWRVTHGELDGISPKLIVVLAGTNNLGRDEPRQIVEGIEAIVGEVRRRCPEARVLVLSIFPRGEKLDDKARVLAGEVNAQLKRASFDDHVKRIDIGDVFLNSDRTVRRDLMPDFIHPNDAGYEAWASAIQSAVNQYAGSPGN